MKSEPLQIEWVTKIFMRLHGRFGNAFFDKFRIGELNQTGQDLGVENAKQVWSQELAGISAERIKAALDSNYEYPPSCDEFKANCKVKAQQQDYKALSAPNNKETNKEYADNVVNFIAQNEKPKQDYRAWIKRVMANPSAWPEITIQKAKEVLAEQAA